jgi:transcriptional regulator with XRE-family HTH domain
MPEAIRPPRIGKNLARLRKGRGITLEALARISGVSKSMLFQIEQERVNPSVITLWKVARGLNVSFPTILSGEHPSENPFEILRKGDAPAITSEDGLCELHGTSNVHFQDMLETYTLTISAGGALRSKPHFPGTEEILVVTKGRVRITTSGESAELKRGDSARYHVDADHAIEGIGGQAEAFLIVYHKNRSVAKAR